MENSLLVAVLVALLLLQATPQGGANGSCAADQSASSSRSV